MRLFNNYFISTLQKRSTESKVIFEKTKALTAGELLQSSISLAAELALRGLKPGDRVLLVVQPGISFLQIMYANMLLRTVVAIIDPEMGQENYEAKMLQFNPQFAFVDSRLILLNEHPILKYIVFKWKRNLPRFTKPKQCVLFTTGLRLPIFQKTIAVNKLLRSKTIPNLLSSGNRLDPCLVTYTSGTLQAPKGVVHSFYSLENSISLLTNLVHSNKDTSIATHLPHFALLGINAGISVYLWPYNLVPKDKITYIIQHNISTLFGPPSDFVAMVKYLESNRVTFPNCIKNIYLGSAPVFPSFLKKLLPLVPHAKVTCLYGMTENLMVAMVDGKEKLEANSVGDLVGNALPGVTVNFNQSGEILIESAQLFSNYWGMEIAQSPHPTGDLGEIDSKGRLVLKGRAKDMIIRGNFNIYPALYEPTITKISGIEDAVMIGVYNDKKADEEVILVVETSTKITTETIMKNLQHGKYSIDREALPDKIFAMPIPRHGRQNKVNRKLLRSQLLEIL